MYDPEKHLNRLPRGKLNLLADLRIRLRIYFALLKAKLLPDRSPGGFYALKKITVALILVLSIFGATSVYAYESNEVTRGHALYGLKRAMEQAELKLAFSPVKKIKLNSNLAARRLAEAEVLSQRLAVTSVNDSDETQKSWVDENLAQTVEEAGQNISAAAVAAAGLSDSNQVKQALEIIVGVSSDQEEALGNLAQAVGVNADETVVDNIVVTLDRAKMEKRKALQRIGKIDDSRERNNNAVATGTLTFPENEDNIAATATTTEVRQSLKRIEDQAVKLKQKLSNSQVPPKEIDKFSQRLEGKLKKARQAIDEGKIDRAKNLLETGQALVNNGDHFFKNIKQENLKDDSDNLGQGTKNSGRRTFEINKNLKFKEKETGKSEPGSENFATRTPESASSAPAVQRENLSEPVKDEIRATTSQSQNFNVISTKGSDDSKD